jgi:hypothetical protein
MTICVSVKVSEGLVLAADSTAAIQGNIQDPRGNISGGILKTYDHVRKLSHIKDYPVGTLTWGIALVGARSVESLIKEYEYSLPSFDEERESIKELNKHEKVGNNERNKLSVEDIARGLLNHVKTFYDDQYKGQPKESQPFLEILVSGYSAGKFFPEQWVISLPRENEIHNLRPDDDGKPSFGANWFGLTDAITRLHWGKDAEVINIIAQHFKVEPDEVNSLLKGLEYRVLFDGMPLQDAIDYAVYLVNIAIGRFRFVIGAPLCGGAIDVAVITPNEFTWVQRKSWKVNYSSYG